MYEIELKHAIKRRFFYDGIEYLGAFDERLSVVELYEYPNEPSRRLARIRLDPVVEQAFITVYGDEFVSHYGSSTLYFELCGLEKEELALEGARNLLAYT